MNQGSRCQPARVVLHYIPYIEVVRRLLPNEAFAGKMYHTLEMQWSARHNGGVRPAMGPGAATQPDII